MRRLWLTLVVVSMACAHPQPPKQPNQSLRALARADAAMLEGCYDCLIEARDIYARVGVGPVRRLIVTRLFEAELLITLREKELALAAAEESIERARALSRELPGSIEADRYLAMVEAVPPDDVGKPRTADQMFRRMHSAIVPRINGEIDWLRAPDAGALRQPVREYVAMAIDCMYASRPRQGGPVRTTAPSAPAIADDAPPLLVYRAGICITVNKARMEQVRTAVPRFVETSLFLGRLAVSTAKNDGGGKAKELLTEAYARFPKSSSITYMSGNFNQLIGDCREALRYYDETVALESLHENALLGRTVCLTYLKRTDEAMAAATRIIDLKLDNISDGFYWRAWNQEFMLKAYPGARSDIESAKAIRATIQVYTLAGIIEHDQDDAETRDERKTPARDAVHPGSSRGDSRRRRSTWSGCPSAS
jgi:tetratricopeptide (TPR) repeat protein